MLKTRLAIALLLTLAGVHAASTAYKLLINGKSATHAIVVNGRPTCPWQHSKRLGSRVNSPRARWVIQSSWEPVLHSPRASP